MKLQIFSFNRWCRLLLLAAVGLSTWLRAGDPAGKKSGEWASERLGPGIPLLADFSAGRSIVDTTALESARLRIIAPDGRVLVARRIRSDRHGATRGAWIGRLEGSQVSRVVFGISRNRIAGVVDQTAANPEDRWTILPESDGSYQISVGSGTAFVCGTSDPTALPPPSFTPAGPLSTAVAQGSVQAALLATPNVADLLVVYSPASRLRYGQAGLEAMITQAVADANTTLANSFAATVVRLVGMQEVAHVESAGVDISTVVGRMIVTSDGFLDDVPPLRDQFGADIVSLVSEDTGASGVAYIPFFQGSFRPDWNYSAVNSGALLSGAFTHEIGHNLGCNHDRNNLLSTGQAPYPYSYGIQQCGFDGLGFRDIMAYECSSGFGFSQRLNYFSNPWLTYLGRPLGVDFAIDPAQACDNARSIREAAPNVAGFRASAQAVPAPPTALVVTTAAFNQLDLAWTAGSADYAAVEIQRAAVGTVDWTVVGFVTDAASIYSDRPLSAGTAYQYRVRALNSAGFSGFSPAVAAQTSPVASVPAGASALTATLVSKARIDLFWTDVATTEDGYRIERSVNGGPFQIEAITTYNSTGYNDGANLQMGSTYVYRVTPFNSAGDGPAVTVSVLVPTLPAPPSDLTVTPLTHDSARLGWTDQSNNETGFDLQRSVDGILFNTIATRVANETSHTNTSLVAGVNYRYRVWSRNASGYSTTPSPTAAILWPTPLSTPSGLTAIAAGASTVNLAWTDNAPNESAYLVERAGVDGVYGQIASLAANTTAYVDLTTVGNSTYSYRVRATTGTAFSAYSTAASVTTPLTPPTGLTAVAASSTQVNLSWTDNAGNETGYLVERAPSSGVFSQIASLAANATAYADTATVGNTTYSYRVRAAAGAVFSIYSATATLTTPLAPPTGLTAVAASSAQVNLTWTDNAANETGYLVERAPSSGVFTQIASLAANATAYNDTTAIGNTTYSYRVRAAASPVFSTYSATASVTTPLAPPTGLTAVAASSTQVNLIWADNAPNETGYLVERAPSSGVFTQIASLPANTTSYADTSAVGNTTYSYRVRAAASAVFSTYSATATVTTPLSPPTGLTAVAASSTQVNLTWIDNAPNESGYRVERAGTSGVFAQIASLPANTTTYSDTTTAGNTTYSYRVRATATGAIFSTYSATTTVTTPLAPPTGLTAVAASSTRVNLTWTDNAPNENGYRVERAGSTGVFAQIASLSANTTTYSDTTAVGNTTYSYRVRATASGAVFSAYSATTTVTTPLAPPTGLTAAAIASTQVNLNWTDNAANESGYLVERAGTSGVFAQIASLSANTTTYSDTTAIGNTTYSYRVRATAAGAVFSTYSATATVTTPLAPPTGLTAVAASSTQVNLTWTDNASNETGYLVERAGPSGVYAQIATLASNTTTYTDPATVGNTAYSYRVRTTAGAVVSVYSSVATVTTPLAPPTGLGAVAASSTQVNLIWTDNASNETGYLVERAGSDGTYTQIASLAANTTAYADATTAGNTTYNYRIRAVAGLVFSAYSASATVTTPLAPPTTLTAVAAASTQVNLIWTDNASDETGYLVERAGPDGVFLQIVALPANTTAYNDTSVSDNSAYSYRVRAVTGTVFSAYSAVAAVTTPLSAPSALSALATSSTQVQLTWTDNSTGETGYLVERAGTSGIYTQLASLPANTTTYTDTAAAGHTTYSYRTRAVAGPVFSAYSPLVTVTTPLAPPTGLVADATGTGVTLNWTDNAADETGYLVERAGANGIYTELVSLPVNATTCTDAAVTDNTTYTYRVRAAAGAETSAYSSTVTVTTPLAAPTSLTAVPGSSTLVTLTWADNASGETGYFVERADPIGSYTEIAALSANTTTYADTAVTGNTTYLYRVRAASGVVFSAYSVSVTITTPLAPPSGLIAAAESSTRVNLTWIDNAPNETGYQVERAGADGVYSPLILLPADTTAFTDTTALGNTTYSYRVQAAAGPAFSAYSAVTTVTTPLAPPTGLNAVATLATQVNLTWTDNALDETGYLVERAGADGIYTLLASLPPDTTTWTDATVVDYTTYGYRVRAVAGPVLSAYSTAITVTTPLAPPTGLSAVATSGTQVNLNWTDNTSAETMYLLERAGPDGIYASLAQLPPDTISYIDSGVTDHTTYSYRVRAGNEAGYSSYSPVATLTTPLGTPSGLLASSTSGQVTLTWTDNAANETEYLVERADSGGAYAVLASLPANTTTCMDATVADNTTYSYRVRAAAGPAFSAYSPGLTLVTPIAAPTALNATAASGTLVALTWTDNTSAETGYVLERAGADGTYASIASLPPNTITYLDVTVSDATTYSYRIHAVAGTERSPDSADATIITPLAEPATLTATTTASTQVNLSWTDNTSRETGYWLERAGPTGDFSLLAALPPNTTDYADTTVTDATTYSYRVRAIAAGAVVSSYSPVATVTTALAEPTALAATAVSSTQVNLTWLDITAGESAYLLERAGPDGIYTQLISLPPNTTTFADPSVTDATTYYYRVRAAAGPVMSAYSTAATVTTPLAPPTALAAVATSSGRVSLTWIDTSGSEISYVVERSNGGGAFAQIAVLDAGSTSYVDATVTAQTTYVYQVRTWNPTGASVPSAPVEVTTPAALPLAPTGVAATAVSSTRIDVAWIASTGIVDGFEIERSLLGGSYSVIATVGASALSFEDPSVSPGTSYQYRIRALNSAGYSPYSSVGYASTPMLLPAAPDGLTATARSGTSIRLAWTDNSSNEAGFDIERQIGSGWTVLGSVAANVTAVNVNGLSPGTTYTFRLRARNTGGYSAYSNTATGSTPLAVAGAWR